MAAVNGNASPVYDVLIIGCGISGINSAYRLQEGIPDAKYAILEGRKEMGGTWSLFKYPGIRSDSDLHTFGFGWDPWVEDRAIADAPSILSYLKDVAGRHGIDKHVKYSHKVQSMNWSSETQLWSLQVQINEGEMATFHTKFVLIGTGYYDYNAPLLATIPGLDNFQGRVVHPQFWPEDLDYSNQKVVIIGSGATAVTLLPAMVDKAEKVTMLQRSPSYFFSAPLVEPIDTAIRKYFPSSWAHQLIRWRFMILGWCFYEFCRLFPGSARNMLRKEAAKALPAHIPLDPHFAPVYNPWDQRMCIVPGGNFFEALHTGKADIVTDHIENIKGNTILLKSGQTLDADVIVTATGLKIQLGGSIKMSVDKEPFNFGDKFVWKGALLQDVPNLAFVFGYTNASWTLGADATAQLVVRLLKSVRSRGMTSVVPRLENPEEMKEVPMLNLNSTYIKSAVENKSIPKGGNVYPWKPRNNYFQDYWYAKWADLTTGLQFNRVSVD